MENPTKKSHYIRWNPIQHSIHTAWFAPKKKRRHGFFCIGFGCERRRMKTPTPFRCRASRWTSPGAHRKSNIGPVFINVSLTFPWFLMVIWSFWSWFSITMESILIGKPWSHVDEHGDFHGEISLGFWCWNSMAKSITFRARLPSEATDASLRKMCHCFGLQARQGPSGRGMGKGPASREKAIWRFHKWRLPLVIIQQF